MSEIDIKAIAASIADELTEHPDRWTQRFGARDAHGDPTYPCSNRAVCWCLAGLIEKRLGDESLDDFRVVAENISGAFTPEFAYIPDWNDAEGRTVADVIALCRKVAQEPTT